MANKPNNLLEWMLMMASAKLPTKQGFGDAMHDQGEYAPTRDEAGSLNRSRCLSEKDKNELAKRVILAGGYACLEDDND